MLDAMRKDMGYSEGKTKCGEVKRVGPCRGLHRGDWGDRGDVVRWEGGEEKRYRVWGAIKEG